MALIRVSKRARRARRRAQLAFLKYPLRLLLQPRRLHAYCVGTPKSGTHSIAGLFESRYRVAHEPLAHFLINLIYEVENHQTDEKRVAKFFRRRDKYLWLELESSHFNAFFAGVLSREFERAKFILTIRDCYSWLDSWFNHQLSGPATRQESVWSVARDLYFRPESLEYSEEEKKLADLGLYPLDGYLSFWSGHNARVLSAVPEERLLVVRTHEIQEDTAKIAAHLDVPVETLEPAQAHLFKARRRFGLLSQIDRGFLEEKVDLHCRELMDTFFPEIRSMADVMQT